MCMARFTTFTVWSGSMISSQMRRQSLYEEKTYNFENDKIAFVTSGRTGI